MEFAVDLNMLKSLVRIAAESSKILAGGALANALDSWIAFELRSAGFGFDEIWPRPARPRVLSKDLSNLLISLPKQLREEVARRIESTPSIGPSDARIFGRAYEKQVDVVLSDWRSGPELLISTKTQTASFGKNLSNRFEEAYGDVGNLRGRFPLAATGFLFMQRASILKQEPEAFKKSVDMMRKLRDRGAGDGYTATALMLFDVTTSTSGIKVNVDQGQVPSDLRAGQFFERLVTNIFEAAPVGRHEPARLLRGSRLGMTQDQEQE